MQLRIKIAYILILIVMPLLAPAMLSGSAVTTMYASAANGDSCNLKRGSGALKIPTWYQYLPGERQNGQCEIKTDDLGGKVVILILMGIFDILLFIAGVLAVVMIIWGGFKLLTSDGEPQKIAAARTTLFNALVGMVIAVIASQIVGFIAGGLA